MKRILLMWFVVMVAAQSLNAVGAPSIAGITTPYSALQSKVQFGGVVYPAGVVAYGPANTPIAIHGSNFGSSGVVTFQGVKNTTTATVSYTSSDGANISLSIPTGATTGTVFVTTGSQTSNAAPILVTGGTYSPNCPVPPIGQAALTVTGVPTTAQIYGATFPVGSTGGSGTGLVTFNGSGACSASGTTVKMTSGTGTCSVTATKAADVTYASATSATTTVSATQATQTINLTALPSPVANGSAPITMSATGGGSGNPVTFSVVSGPGSVSGSLLTITGVGTVVVAADQTGNANYSAATEVTQNVVAVTMAVTVTTSNASVSYGTAVTLTATMIPLSPTMPTGAITFWDGSKSLGTATLSNGTATYTANLAAGSHPITVSYGGDSHFAPTTSDGLTQMVNQATLMVTANNLSMVHNSAVPALTYTLSGFLNGDTASVLSGNPLLSTAALSTSALGSYSITVAPGTLSATSYSFNYVEGTMTVRALLEPGIIQTVAGNGTEGFSGDGGLATSAQLHNPHGVAVDALGDLQIAEYYNHRIRMVIAATGMISTVAGNGTGGYSGDGGLATSAELYYPQGVAMDVSGNVYIADTGNSRIRMVSALTSKISTVAGNGTDGYSGDGGSATSAKLSSPGGVAVDAAGNIYIADSGNNRIRKISAATGKISTIAGNGTAGYSGDGGLATQAAMRGPMALVVDGSGNIYFADYNNYCVRMVAAATGYISTVAGNGTQGNSGDGGLATNAEMNFSYGVAVDSSGNVYIGDYASCRVRMVAVGTGYISTVAGNGACGYSGDGGLAIQAGLAPMGVASDASGNIYIADLNERVRVVGGHMATPTVAVSASQPSIPYGTAVTFTATVPAAATGTVTFFDGSSLGTATVSAGVASYTTTALPSGPNIITASYSGDTNYTPSSSPGLTVTVTAVTLTTSAVSVGYGTQVTFTATTPSLATGTVFFQDNGTALGTGNVIAGRATFATSSLATGQHVIVASYSGDSNYSAAASIGLTQTVLQSALEIITTALSNGIQTWSYAATLQVAGGTAPYSWSVSSGSLPVGLALGNANGTISGMPTTSGASSFTALVTDATLKTASAPLSIVINPAESPSQMSSLSPSSGLPGTIVTILGSNFGASQAEESTLLLGGSAVSPLQWSDSAIVFGVPSGAQAGSLQVTVVVTNGNTSSQTFTVLGTPSCTVN